MFDMLLTKNRKLFDKAVQKSKLEDWSWERNGPDVTFTHKDGWSFRIEDTNIDYLFPRIGISGPLLSQELEDAELAFPQWTWRFRELADMPPTSGQFLTDYHHNGGWFCPPDLTCTEQEYLTFLKEHPDVPRREVYYCRGKISFRNEEHATLFVLSR